MSSESLKAYAYERFSEHVGLSVGYVRDDDPTMSEVIENADGLINSVDLMEAFAKTSNDIHAQHGIRIQLPALPLDTPMSEVMRQFIERASEKESA